MSVSQKLYEYINGPLKKFLKFSEIYTVQINDDVRDNDGKIVVKKSSVSKTQSLIDLIRNDNNLKKTLEKEFGKELSKSYPIDSTDIVILDDTHFWILMYSADRSNIEYFKSNELLKYYAMKGDVDKFRAVFNHTELDSKDKASLFDPRMPFEINKIIIESGIANEWIFSEGTDKYNILWNGSPIDEQLIDLILNNSDNKSHDILVMFSYITPRGGSQLLEKYLPDQIDNKDHRLLYDIRRFIENSIRQQFEESFIILWGKYHNYFSKEEVLNLYETSLTSLDQELPYPNFKIVAILANSEEVRDQYNI